MDFFAKLTINYILVLQYDYPLVLHSAETKAKLSEANQGDKPLRGMLGKTHSPKALAKLSAALKGEGVPPTTRAKMSAAQGTTIFVYLEDDGTLIDTFCSSREAGKILNCGKNAIFRYAKNAKL